MGHRRYKIDLKTRSEHSQLQSLRRSEGTEAMPPVNGLTNYDDEHVQIANREREAFRDAVSKRMGELLLRGVTMLDSYCQICNGILMENRNGQRNCVTCELYAEKTSEGNPNLAKQIMHLGEHEIISSFSPNVAEIPLNNSKENVAIPAATEKNELPNLRIKNIAFKQNMTQSYQHKAEKVSSRLPGHTSAIKAVDKKLAWAAERLNNTEDIAESRILLDLISDAIKILNLS